MRLATQSIRKYFRTVEVLIYDEETVQIYGRLKKVRKDEWEVRTPYLENNYFVERNRAIEAAMGEIYMANYCPMGDE